MLIGAYGRFWEADKVDWSKARLLGQRGKGRNTQVVNFGAARGVYVLYDELGVYYAGLCRGENGLGGRLKDHLRDKHADRWSRFSWFAFDSPDLDGGPDEHGIHRVEQWDSIEATETTTLIKDVEALLIAAMRPWGNSANPRFQEGDEWLQVAERATEVELFSDIAHLVKP
ncbi:GIY-YIG nuclease family protein [Aeromicrobium massiliense]|uniref:GIY-YIG nuclease family protein n=1 Tax=Aeromicrobium massiliense TaxID=1464554 RepID=UPI000301465A|nr:GIY-YIG nuclease family protein [Aeromicrobium massiliense]